MDTLKKHDIEYTGAYLEFHKFLATQNELKYDFFSISKISFYLLVITLVVKKTWSLSR